MALYEHAADVPASAALPRHHLPRPRLTAALTTRRVLLVEAGAGWGKTALGAEVGALGGVRAVRVPAGARLQLDTLVASTSRTVREAGGAAAARRLEGTAAAAAGAACAAALNEVPFAVALIVDAGAVEGAVAGALAELAGCLAERHRVVVLARRLAASLQALAGLPDVALLRGAELSFTAAEVAALLEIRGTPSVPPSLADTIVAQTDGWPAAVVAAASACATAASPAGARAALTGGRAFTSVVAAALERLEVRHLHALRPLAWLPCVDRAMLEAVVGRGVLARLLDRGLPLAPSGSGWWMLPAPVRRELRAGTSPDPNLLRDAAGAYVGDGRVQLGMATLLDAGDADAAARLLASVPLHLSVELDYADVARWCAALPSRAVEAHPRVLLHVARSAQVAGLVERRAATLVEAADIAAAADDRELLREVRAEQALDHWNESRHEAAERTAAELVATAAPSELAARARALDVLGRVAGRRDGDRERAARLLAQSIELAEQLGCSTWVAQASMPLAWDVHYALGHIEPAVQRLDHAIALLPPKSRLRAVLLTFRAEFLDTTGRYAEAAASLDEAIRIGTALADPRVIAYVAWERARQASQQGHAADLYRHLQTVDDNLGDWFDHESGAEFLADAADMLDRVGDEGMVATYLARSRTRTGSASPWCRLSQAAVAARSGDAAEALTTLAELEAEPRLPPRARWRILLLMAVAATRSGDPGAAARAAAAFEAAAALGHPEFPLVVDGAWAERLLEPAACAGSAAAALLLRRRPRLRVTVLGGFAITSCGRALEPPGPRPAALMKLVALSSAAVPVDDVVEALWPRDDPELGRIRLRNALSRLRERCGDAVVRTPDALRLDPAVEVDVREFELLAERAVTRGDRGAVRAALAAYTGPLLPEDRDAEWSMEHRRRLTRLHTELLDRAARLAEREGDAAEAMRLLHAAEAEDPGDPARTELLRRLRGG